MWGLFLSFFISVLILYLTSYGIVLKSQYDTMKEFWKQKTVYQGFFTTASSDSADLQSIVTGDVDVKRDNCMQAVAQICFTLALECQTRNALDTWGWAIAAVAPDYLTLDSADYEEVNSAIKLKSPGYVDLSKIPEVGNFSGCGRDQLIIRGAYYYSSVVRVLGCDEYGLDLNEVNVDGQAHPCSYIDTLRYK